jgi:hypothetical protein
MSYSSYQWRCINHYLKKNNAIPQLSAFPVVRFTNRETKEEGEANIQHIEDVYIADREKAKREASEARKAQNRKEKRGA